MAFTEKSAKALVVGAVAGAAILSSVDSLATGTMPSVVVGVGAVVIGSMLYALADVAPPLAASFALVLITAAALTNGVKVAGIVTNATRGK